jgi:hypothetical protein
MKWYFQFTLHDVHDWDSTHTPILFDDTIAGQPRKLVAVANRNGFFYVLDRVTGAFLLGRPYTQVTWAREIDGNGRPVVLPNTDPTAEGNRVCPSGTGGTNWHSPSYSPRTHLVYFFSYEQCDTFMSDEKLEPPYQPGRLFIGKRVLPVARRAAGERDPRRRSRPGTCAGSSASTPTPGRVSSRPLAASCSPATDETSSHLTRDRKRSLAHPARRLDHTAAW